MTQQQEAPRRLTDAERKYTLDVARGFTARQSASRWGVSENTVCTMRRRVIRLLGARSITQAVVLAMQQGNFDFDDL